MLNKIIQEELRNFCNCPKKYQLIDFFGSALGVFFIVKNSRELKQKVNGWSLLGLGIGAVMFYIHTSRFFYAEQVKSGTRKEKKEE